MALVSANMGRLSVISTETDDDSCADEEFVLPRPPAKSPAMVQIVLKVYYEIWNAPLFPPFYHSFMFYLCKV